MTVVTEVGDQDAVHLVECSPASLHLPPVEQLPHLGSTCWQRSESDPVQRLETDPPRPVVPDPEVPEKAHRRRFSGAYRLKILQAVDACSRPGEIGALLRREGLYSSHLSKWRRQRKLEQAG